MYSIISVFIMNLTYIARINPDLPCTILFDTDEWKILYCATNRTKKPPEKTVHDCGSGEVRGLVRRPQNSAQRRSAGSQNYLEGFAKALYPA
jgi:hypothetical protein